MYKSEQKVYISSCTIVFHFKICNKTYIFKLKHTLTSIGFVSDFLFWSYIYFLFLLHEGKYLKCSFPIVHSGQPEYCIYKSFCTTKETISQVKRQSSHTFKEVWPVIPQNVPQQGLSDGAFLSLDWGCAFLTWMPQKHHTNSAHCFWDTWS